jgi:hypothetical protein
VLLRYFENKSLREVGAARGTSEDAAQKRVSRAVERLREFFSKRNVTIGASGLAVLISANAVQSAPVGLAVMISTAALTGAVIQISTVIAATKTIAMTTLQKSIIGAAFVTAVGTGIFEAHQAAQLREQNQTLQQQQTSLAEQIQHLQRERDDATNRLAGLLAENEQSISNSNENELLKLRGEVTQLQSQANDPTAIAAKAWLQRASELKQWADENPTDSIPEFQFLTRQDWLNAARANLNTETDYRRAMSSLRQAAENKFANQLQPALKQYLQANNGQFPTDLNQLQSYFIAPVDNAILQRYEIAPASTVPNVGVGTPNIITEKTTVDDLLDTRLVIGQNGFGSTDWLSSELGGALNPVYSAFARANPNGYPGNYIPSQLLPYATTPEQQAAIQKLIEQKQLQSAP